MTIPQFQKTVLDWYKENRRALPWRKTRDPYKILVSEVMLQQTQVSRVLPKYKEFLKEFPTFEALAKAPDKKLLKVWSGLGYWRRAKNLKETARNIPMIIRGNNHKDPKTLETLPGVGPYTARALACFSAKGGPASDGASCEAFVDTNIRRVYLHFFFKGRKSVSDKEILKIAQKTIDTLPKGVTAREWHYALFDYGAAELKDKTINKRSRHYAKQSKFEGSFRSFRTRAVQFLLAQPRQQTLHARLETFISKELQAQNARFTAKEIIGALLKDKLIKKTRTHYSI